MFSNRLAFAALTVACVAAAAGGGYLATRHNVVPASEAATPELPRAAVATPPAQLTQPVEATEAFVGDSFPASGAAANPTPASREAEARAGAAAGRAVPRTRLNDQRAASNRSRPASPARDGEPNSVGRPTRVREQEAVVPDQTTAAVRSEISTPTEAVDPAPADPLRVQVPPQRVARELVVSADSVIGLQTERALTSERARVEDQVEARVVRDVRVDGEIAIPAGSRALGSVMVVDRGGKFKERARLGIRFHTLVLSDGTRVPITTETIYRYGEEPGNRAAAKIGGGAVAGAILGAILGGAKGAAVGASTGAAGGTATVAAGGRSAAEFPAGAEVTARILSPIEVTIEQ
jgi:hypothetical protein